MAKIWIMPDGSTKITRQNWYCSIRSRETPRSDSLSVASARHVTRHQTLVVYISGWTTIQTEYQSVGRYNFMTTNISIKSFTHIRDKQAYKGSDSTLSAHLLLHLTLTIFGLRRLNTCLLTAVHSKTLLLNRRIRLN